MKSREDAHATLDAWFDGDATGNLIFFKAPHARECDCIIEQVIKAREMSPKERAAWENAVDTVGAEKGEFWRDKDGDFDRIKIVKGF